MTAKSHLLEKNPVQELEVPSVKKSLPRYLTLEESLELLSSVEVKDFESARDYCMITLFLNCGMRLSELVGINLSDMKEETLTITGKGNKERVVYLNDACRAAIKTYLAVRASGWGERQGRTVPLQPEKPDLWPAGGADCGESLTVGRALRQRVFPS